MSLSLSLTFSIYLSRSSFFSDQLHLGVGVDGDHVVALGGLHTSLGVGLAVQVVLDEEVAPLLQVEAAVITHEALRVVQLVTGLHDGAPERAGTFTLTFTFSAFPRRFSPKRLRIRTFVERATAIYPCGT